MIRKQVASQLFNRNRTDNDSMTTQQMPDAKQPASEIVTKALDKKNQTSTSASDTNTSSLPISCEKVIQSAKKVLGKGKDLLSELYK